MEALGPAGGKPPKGPAMKYLVSVGGETFRIEIAKDDGGYVARTEHGVLHVDSRDLYHGEILSLLIEGVPHDVLLTREPGGTGVYHILVHGWVTAARVQDEIWAQAAEARSAQATGLEEIRAPMPGLVVGIAARAGEEIPAGSAVVVVEAMKMQNEIVTESGGRVEEVLVETGRTVEAGQILAIVRRAEETS
jgi:biotin carboxyl carrier protein